jgi:hypothetical protein
MDNPVTSTCIGAMQLDAEKVQCDEGGWEEKLQMK